MYVRPVSDFISLFFLICPVLLDLNVSVQQMLDILLDMFDVVYNIVMTHSGFLTQTM